MATFDHLSNMNDVALKPRLLRAILKEQLPDEKHPFSISSEFSRVVSIIKTHNLLSESLSEEKSADAKLIGRWKSAIDSWVDRILALVSSNMPDKCWAGICLLGFTCQECSSARFLASYAEWFQKLLLVLQQVSACPHFLRVASCTSMSDLFVRLSGFPSEKKDGSSYAVRVVQQVLKLLNDDDSEAIWEGALNLLCTIIISFPSSIHRHYDNVEYAIASKLLSGGCSQDVLEKLAYCLALLPKSRGDEESWSLLMQKILVVINDQLNIFFQGLEEETKRIEVVRLLVAPGKHAPPPLGNYNLDEASNEATNKTEHSLVSNISTLMLCCCTMLTNSYPVRVNVPVPLLLALVERVLMANGSLPEMSLPFVTSKQQENICSELPVLHSFSLELLASIIKGMGSYLLPYAASIVRLITRYFKTCLLPELRIKLYSITRILLISRGVGMASCLKQEVINNALVDLSTNRNKSSDLSNSSISNVSTDALLQHGRRKRKHGSDAGSFQSHEFESSVLGVENPKNLPVTSVSLKIAALEALETLINVAGGLRSEEWRSNVDNLLIIITRESFQERPVIGNKSMFEQKELAAITGDFQLAALRALLASFLSFARVRPPYLAQGLELFRIGRQQPGIKLAEFCTHALSALEVLVHPRVLSLSDYPYANHNSDIEAGHDYRNDYAVGQKHCTPFRLHDTPESDDDLCARWVDNGEEPNVPLPADAKYSEEPSFEIQDRNEQVIEEATHAEVDTNAVDDEIIAMRDQPEEALMQFQEPISCTSIPVAEASHGSVDTEMLPVKIVSDSTVPHHASTPKESGQGAVMINNDGELTSPSNSTMPGTSGFVKGQGLAIKLGNEEDGFPDIVDADPDSDSE